MVELASRKPDLRGLLVSIDRDAMHELGAPQIQSATRAWRKLATSRSESRRCRVAPQGLEPEERGILQAKPLESGDVQRIAKFQMVSSVGSIHSPPLILKPIF